MEEHSPKRTLIGRIIHDPVSIISLSIGLIGIILAIIFFCASQEQRELVYTVNPVKTQVVVQGQATGLEVLHNGVNLGNTDITAAQVAIWNSGDLSIRPENILKDVIIYTEPPVQILEASIVKNSRDNDITEFEIDYSAENLAIGRVPVAWKILEEDDGASIQLIYLGASNVEIRVDGAIEDCGAIKQLESEKRPWWVYILIPIFATTLGWFVNDINLSIQKKGIKNFLKLSKKRIVSILFIVVVCLFALNWIIKETSGLNMPPFGF